MLRLTADAVVDLWERGGGAPAGDRSAARNEVLAAGTQVLSWYEAMANALAGAGDVPPELPPDKAADGRLIDAVQRDLSGTDGQGTATAVRMIWTADHLDVARRLQARVAGPARQAAAYQRGHGQPWRRQPPQARIAGLACSGVQVSPGGPRRPLLARGTDAASRTSPAGVRRTQRIFHLHGLHDGDHLPGGDLLALRCRDPHHRAPHGRGNGAAGRLPGPFQPLAGLLAPA